MRLVERTLKEIEIAPHTEQKAALGGVTQGFTELRIPARGSVQPASNTLNHAANALNFEAQGMRMAQTVRVLLDRDTKIEPGDGVCMDGARTPQWLCVAVENWSAHKLARLERRI